jgi:hypothetical protein
VDRTASGQEFAAVEREFFEQGQALEAEAAEERALQEAADQPERPGQRRGKSAAGKVLALGVVVAGVLLIGHRWFTGTADATPARVASGDSAHR